MKKILFLMNFFPPNYVGGAEISAYHTCRGLLEQGYACTVLVVNNRMMADQHQHYQIDGIPVHSVSLQSRRTPANDAFDWRVFEVVQQELQRVQPDLVHVHNISGSTLAPYLACQVERVPVVNTLHDLWLLCPNNMCYQADGTFCNPNKYPNGCGNCFQRYDYWAVLPQRRKLFAALTSSVQAFISPSQGLIEQHVAAGFAPERFRLVPYGAINEAAVEVKTPLIQEIIQTAPQYRNLVFAGGGVEIKGAPVLLKAIPLLLQKVPNLRVLVAGVGEERYINLYKQYAPQVQFLGRVEFTEMRNLFASADLALVASTWFENSPVVIYENFQVGTPVVGSAFGGIPELIDEDQTGYLFPVGDARALAEKVAHHFNKPAYVRRQMGHRCLKKAQEELTMENHLAGIEQVYQEVWQNSDVPNGVTPHEN